PSGDRRSARRWREKEGPRGRLRWRPRSAASRLLHIHSTLHPSPPAGVAVQPLSALPGRRYIAQSSFGRFLDPLVILPLIRRKLAAFDQIQGNVLSRHRRAERIVDLVVQAFFLVPFPDHDGVVSGAVESAVTARRERRHLAFQGP